MKDLVILVPDKNTQFALSGALGRPLALGIRPISFDFRTHPGRDGGVRATGVDVLAPERRRFQHALLVFDLEGSGAAPRTTAIDLETSLDAGLQPVWDARGKSIVIAPEVDVWLWGAENALRDALAWTQPQGVRAWLRERAFDFNPKDKPMRPKEAVEALLRLQQTPRSSAMYKTITSRISLARCSDESFLRLRTTLRRWFPAAGARP